MNILRTITDDQWRKEAFNHFGIMTRTDKWRYTCPKCKKETDSHVKCYSCGFTNMSISAHPWTIVKFQGHKIPVFPFAEVKDEQIKTV